MRLSGRSSPWVRLDQNQAQSMGFRQRPIGIMVSCTSQSDLSR